MNDISKIASWVQRFEHDLERLRQRKVASEHRIASKIRTLVRMVQAGEAQPTAVMAELGRLEKIARSREATHATLEEVEREVDRIYGDQSKNETYYFSRRTRSASEAPMTLDEALEDADDTYGDQSDNQTYYDLHASSETYRELEALTTYDAPEREAEWDGTMNQGFTSVRNADTDWWREAVEDDGNWIDPADQLDLGQPGPYDFNAPMPLDEKYPLGKHDWRDEVSGERPAPHMEPVMSNTRQARMIKAAGDLLSYLMADHGSRCLDDERDRMAVLEGLSDAYRLSGTVVTKVHRVLEANDGRCLDDRRDAAAVASALMNVM